MSADDEVVLESGHYAWVDGKTVRINAAPDDIEGLEKELLTYLYEELALERRIELLQKHRERLRGMRVALTGICADQRTSMEVCGAMAAELESLDVRTLTS